MKALFVNVGSHIVRPYVRDILVYFYERQTVCIKVLEWHIVAMANTETLNKVLVSVQVFFGLSMRAVCDLTKNQGIQGWLCVSDSLEYILDLRQNSLCFW